MARLRGVSRRCLVRGCGGTVTFAPSPGTQFAHIVWLATATDGVYDLVDQVQLGGYTYKVTGVVRHVNNRTHFVIDVWHEATQVWWTYNDIGPKFECTGHDFHIVANQPGHIRAIIVVRMAED